MQAIRQHVTVQQNGLIQVHAPELKPGAVAEAIILESAEILPPPQSAWRIPSARAGAYLLRLEKSMP
jgi:hypothetical protein